MGTRIYIAGVGIISPLGEGPAATAATLRANQSAIRPLDLFPLLRGEPLPVGQVPGGEGPSALPRTHRLAGIAATQAMAGADGLPDAVILGVTTGGILTTEQLLRDRENDKARYRYHGLNSVAEHVAHITHCRGPALVVSTACSSGAVAIAAAMAMLRSGKAKTVLAGGVDSLSRLTYFGFHSLQLVDRDGCRPLDADRHGMAVAEGAAMLLLTTERPDNPSAELLGAGLSCDAYHPAAPHPEGRGALMAMQAALADAGLGPAEIDYINLHGTGTPENDLAESRAITTLFPSLPPLSSIKGATGHTLAAAGAIEAVVATIAVTANFLPANTGCLHPDPALGLVPLLQPIKQPVRAVLSNSFGFGGNNGSLVIAAPDRFPGSTPVGPRAVFAVHGCACLTGAGNTAASLPLLARGRVVAGMTDLERISENLPPRLVRRLKRLARMTLSLAVAARQDSGSGLAANPVSVFMGSGWGALSETYDFLARLTETDEQFPSPTDFVGSVHNGPAGQVAIMFGATGANITTSGGDFSFEQSLLMADLMMQGDGCCLVLGADEGHQLLSPLLDPSIAPDTPLADGGGALCLSRNREGARCLVRMPFYRSSAGEEDLEALIQAIQALDGAAARQSRCVLVLAGIPAAAREAGEAQLARLMARLMAQSGITAPVVRYRDLTGEFASASAVAAVMAVSFLTGGDGDDGGGGAAVSGDRVLVLGLGTSLSAMEFSRP